MVKGRKQGRLCEFYTTNTFQLWGSKNPKKLWKSLMDAPYKVISAESDII